MPNYANGKIYKITCDENDSIYIGSTTRRLSQRKSEHSSHYLSYNEGRRPNYISAYSIIATGCWGIYLLEDYPCKSKADLDRREGELIQEHKKNCVNYIKPGLTPEERKIIYRAKLLITKANYTEEKKDEIKAKDKVYRDSHKDEQRVRQHNIHLRDLEKNRKKRNDHYAEKRMFKVTCECGSVITKHSFNRHQKTKGHAKKMAELTQTTRLKK
jgi:hypothetical protein